MCTCTNVYVAMALFLLYFFNFIITCIKLSVFLLIFFVFQNNDYIAKRHLVCFGISVCGVRLSSLALYSINCIS